MGIISKPRLVPSRYLRVLGGERRLNTSEIKARGARGVILSPPKTRK